MILVVTDRNGIPLSKRAGAAVFHNRGAFTAWRNYGYGQSASMGCLVRVHKDTGEAAWAGTLGEYLQNVQLFGK